MAKTEKNKKTKLLRKVRESITASEYDLLGMKMYLISCEKSSTIPSEVIISCSIDELKNIIREFRLTLARELYPGKNKKKTKKGSNKLNI